MRGSARRLWLVIAIALSPVAAHGEEGGSGRYQPGAGASFVDMLTGRVGFSYLNSFLNSTGTSGTSEPLEFSGQVDTNVRATAYADTATFLYQTPWRVFGGQYAAAIAIPYVSLDVKAVTRSSPGGARTVRDSAHGLGDLLLLPLMLGWQEGDLRWQAQPGVYAPTGAYRAGRLANLGKNYWTVEPAAAVSYLGTTNHFEATAFAGIDVNTTNHTTAYRTGSQFHLDATVAQHLPLLGGLAGLGANAYYYQQLTGDSGRGARLGPLEGRTVGVGPAVSYVARVRTIDVAAELKWLPDIDVEHRLKGHATWLKLAVSF